MVLNCVRNAELEIVPGFSLCGCDKVVVAPVSGGQAVVELPVLLGQVGPPRQTDGRAPRLACGDATNVGVLSQ